MEIKKTPKIPIKVNTRVNTQVNIKREIADYGYIEDSNLEVVEDGIRQAVRLGATVNLGICLALNNIHKKGLFKQNGSKNFHNYIKTQTMLEYQTAVGYAYIGHRWEFFKEYLTNVGFTAKDGYSKLRHIPKNFENLAQEEKEEILGNLLPLGVNKFRNFIKEKWGAKSGDNKKKPENTFKLREIMDLEFNYSLEKFTELLGKKSHDAVQRLLQVTFNDLEEKIKKMYKEGRLKI